MTDTQGAASRLVEFSASLTPRTNLAETLQQMAAHAARLVNAERASIMLLDEREDGETVLKVHALFGTLPEAALEEKTPPGEGIAGQVLATGRALLVEDLAHSEFAQHARRLRAGSRSFVSAPISVDGRPIGVVNVSDPIGRERFTLDDLALLEVAALFIGKSVQVVQLSTILASRFAQWALAREAEATVSGIAQVLSQNPNQVAKILAKSFFREMVRAGFSASQIIHAASEIIDQLNAHLARLKRVKENTGLE